METILLPHSLTFDLFILQQLLCWISACWSLCRAQETVITNLAELHCQFGWNDTHTWVPGIVSKGFIQETLSGRQMRYIKANWYLRWQK